MNKVTSFYSSEELKELGIQSIGNNVQISKKASIYAPEKMRIGSNVRIDDFCVLSGKIEIHDFVHIAAYSALYGGDQGIVVKDFANISSRVSIYSVSDDYSGATMTSPLVDDKYKNVHSEKVTIGKYAIIGATSVVLPGVSIGEGSAFGAFSFINRNSEPWTINAGIPFHKLRERERGMLQYEHAVRGTSD